MKKMNAKAEFHFCFTRWSRKSYSVFNSIKKKFVLGVLSLACTIISSAGMLNAQDKTIELNEAKITASRIKTFSESTQLISILTRKDIENLPINSIADLINTLPGIDVRARGQNGVQTDISVRGGTPEQTLIMLNGVNITDPQTGHFNANIPINLEDIDRIEILENSNVRTQGPGAFSGAINIITGEGSKSGLNVSLIGGQHHLYSANGSAFLVKNNFKVLLATDHSKSDGYKKATDFRIANYFVQSRYQSKALGDFNIQLGHQSKAFGANGFYTPKFDNQFEYNRTFLGSLEYTKLIGKLEIKSILAKRRAFDRFELIRDSSYGRNFHRTDMDQILVNLSYYSKLGKTSLGAGYKSEDIVSTVLGTLLDKPFEVDFAQGINPKPKYTKGQNRETKHLFINQMLKLGKWTISGGGQLIRFAENNRITGGLETAFRITPKTKLSASIGSSLRYPSFTELFYTAPGYLANNDLKPEKAISYELGIQSNQQNTKWSALLFRREGKEIIDWIMKDDLWHGRNIPKVITSGIQVDYAYNTSWKLLKTLSLGALYQTQNKGIEQYISQYAMDFLRYKFVLGVDQQIVKNLNLGWRIQYRQREGSYLEYLTQQEKDFPKIVHVNLMMRYQMKILSLFISVDNLLNQKYMDISNIEQAGLWVKGGINIKI